VARHYCHSPKFESFSKMHRSNGHAARCCFHQIVEYPICQSGLRYAFLSNGPSPCPIGRNRQFLVVGFHSRSDRRSMMRHGRSLRHERSPLRSLVVARQTPRWCQGALRRCHQHPLLPAREAYLRPFVSGARSDNSPQVTRASKNFNISGSPGKCLLKNALAEAACEKKAVTFVSS